MCGCQSAVSRVGDIQVFGAQEKQRTDLCADGVKSDDRQLSGPLIPLRESQLTDKKFTDIVVKGNITGIQHFIHTCF